LQKKTSTTSVQKRSYSSKQDQEQEKLIERDDFEDEAEEV